MEKIKSRKRQSRKIHGCLNGFFGGRAAGEIIPIQYSRSLAPKLSKNLPKKLAKSKKTVVSKSDLTFRSAHAVLARLCALSSWLVDLQFPVLTGGASGIFL